MSSITSRTKPRRWSIADLPPGWMFLAAVAASWVVLIAAWLVFSAVARQVGAL